MFTFTELAMWGFASIKGIIAITAYGSLLLSTICPLTDTSDRAVEAATHRFTDNSWIVFRTIRTSRVQVQYIWWTYFPSTLLSGTSDGH